MWISFGREVLVLPAAVATAQATLLAGRSCGQQRRARSVQNGRGGQPSRSGDEARFIESEPPDKERIGRRKQGSLR